MKKSLIALAVLAASGAAMAQSSVTIYGVADVWVGSQKGTATDFRAAAEATTPAELLAAGVSVGGKSTTKMGSGGLSGSRIGFKGTEDLGGGLKAVFKLEQGINLTNGDAAGFNRQSYVGLAGGFGEVTFGGTWTAMDDVMGASNSGFDSALSASKNVLVANAVYADHPGSTIKYVSPSFGGFSGGFSYSMDGDSAVKEDVTDFSLSYANGPIAANFAYQTQGDVSGSDDLKITALNGSYDLGVAKLLASYGQTKIDAAKSTDYQFGVDVPLSSALTLSAGYARSKDNAAAGDGKRTGYGIAAGYSLSKRTTAYAGFRTSNMKVAGVKVDEDRLIAVGLRHTF
ncbi:porin [Hydrogenophaga sp.]|uniref:porin n=1 Tax=Hydrogenophaga sp. TaxID=1904254 RepID=UPI00286E1480|nr:porin [Hydrogenophaga sp.]